MYLPQAERRLVRDSNGTVVAASGCNDDFVKLQPDAALENAANSLQNIIRNRNGTYCATYAKTSGGRCALSLFLNPMGNWKESGCSLPHNMQKHGDNTLKMRLNMPTDGPRSFRNDYLPSCVFCTAATLPNSSSLISPISTQTKLHSPCFNAHMLTREVDGSDPCPSNASEVSSLCN